MASHKFIKNPLSQDKCMKCGHSESSHSSGATCEACSNVAELRPFGIGAKQMMLCPDCIDKETKTLQAEIALRRQQDAYQAPELQEARLTAHRLNEVIVKAKSLDSSIKLAHELFNAKTIDFDAIKQAIDSDETITNKVFALAQFAEEKIEYLQGVIFNLQKATVEAASTQRSVHDYLNNLRTKLTIAERAKLKQADIHYDTRMPKAVSQPKIKLSQKKYTDREVREAVRTLNIELGVSPDEGIQEYTVRTVMLGKSFDLEQTIGYFRRMAKEGLSSKQTKEEVK